MRTTKNEDFDFRSSRAARESVDVHASSVDRCHSDGSQSEYPSVASPNGRGRTAHVCSEGESSRIQRKNAPQGFCESGFAEIQERGTYKLFTGLIIVLNVVMMVAETDMQAVGQPLPIWMKVVSTLFFLIYVADLFLTVYSYRREFCSNLMNLLDASVLSIDILVLFTSEVFDQLPNLTVLRTFRILRVVKVLNNALAFRELYLMMQGLVLSLRSIMFGTAMIALLLTVWSILAVTVIHPRNTKLFDEGVYGDCGEWCRDAFSTVMRANLTFFQTIIGGDSWGYMAVPLITRFPSTMLIIVPAFLMVQVGMLNVIAAVIVDRQQQARVNDEALTHAEHLEHLRASYGRLRALFTKMDEDQGGSLTLEELIEAWYSQPEFREMLEMMDISKDDIPIVFEILDTDQSGDVTYNEFVEKLHYIRHINAHTLLVFMQTHIQKLLRNSDISIEQLQKLTGSGIQPGPTDMSPRPSCAFSAQPSYPSGRSNPEEPVCGPSVPSVMQLQKVADCSLTDDRREPEIQEHEPQETQTEMGQTCQAKPAFMQAAESKAEVHPGPKLLPCNLPKKQVRWDIDEEAKCFEVTSVPPDTAPAIAQGHGEDQQDLDRSPFVHTASKWAVAVAARSRAHVTSPDPMSVMHDTWIAQINQQISAPVEFEEGDGGGHAAPKDVRYEAMDTPLRDSRYVVI